MEKRKWTNIKSVETEIRHRNEYPVSVMCKTFGVLRSGYYDFVRRLDRPDADAGLA